MVFVQGPGQKSEQKRRTKNFAKLHNHLPLLTMVEGNFARRRKRLKYRDIAPIR